VLSCELCGALDAPSSCRPLVVGGEVIGSVLAAHREPAEEIGSRRIDESVERAAPDRHLRKGSVALPLSPFSPRRPASTGRAHSGTAAAESTI
jgi:hypothetical protein